MKAAGIDDAEVAVGHVHGALYGQRSAELRLCVGVKTCLLLECETLQVCQKPWRGTAILVLGCTRRARLLLSLLSIMLTAQSSPLIRAAAMPAAPAHTRQSTHALARTVQSVAALRVETLSAFYLRDVQGAVYTVFSRLGRGLAFGK